MLLAGSVTSCQSQKQIAAHRIVANPINLNYRFQPKDESRREAADPVLEYFKGYYYLFASIGSCCEGLKSTYTTVVGRSDSLFGPYTDKQGRPMMENHHEVLIHGNDAFVGTGHNSEIVTDDRGNDWVLYHAVSREHPTGRVLMLDRICWRDGWPEVEGASPSLEAEAPEFIN